MDGCIGDTCREVTTRWRGGLERQYKVSSIIKAIRRVALISQV
jgi:hypothetical protein